MFDGSSADSSGRGVSVTTVGTPVYDGRGLVDGASTSSRISVANYYTTPWPYLRAGKEKDAVTIEGWADLMDSDTVFLATRLSYTGVWYYQGIWYFTIVLTTGPINLSYRPDMKETAHVAGIFNGQAMQLYYNGKLVNSYSLTDAELEATIANGSDDGNMWTYANSSALVQGVALYNRALKPEQIQAHYAAGTNSVPPSEASRLFTGVEEKIESDYADLFLDIDGEGFDFFSNATYTCAVSDVLSNPSTAANAIDAGYWIGAYNIAAGGSSIHSITLEWEAKGAPVIETSLNGTTWTAHVNGEKVAGISPGYNTTNKILYVRVTFSLNNYAELRRLRVRGFKTAGLTASQRTLSLPSSATIYNPKTFKEYSKHGVALNGGTISFGPAPVATAGMGFWYYTTDGSLTFPSSSTFYENGVARSPRVVTYRWTHVVLQFSTADNTSTRSITGNGMVAYPTFYEIMPSAAAVKTIYDSFVGQPLTKVSDDTGISLTFQNAEVYSNNWSPLGV